jgi:hypothetical protein
LKKVDAQNFIEGKATLSEEEVVSGLESDEERAAIPRRAGRDKSPTPSMAMSASTTITVSATSRKEVTTEGAPKKKAKSGKKFEKGIATAEGLKIMEAVILDAHTLHTASMALYKQTRKDIFGEPEEQAKLEQWLPYEVMITRKAKWVASLHGNAMGLETLRMDAITGAAPEAEGPVKGWMHVICLEGMRGAAESAIEAASCDDEVKLVATKLKAELKIFRGVLPDLETSIKRLRNASAPEKDKKPKAKAKAKATLVASSGPAKRTRKMPSLLQTQLTSDTEMRRYAFTQGFQEIGDFKTDGKPIAVQAGGWIEKLMRDASFVPSLHAFKRDFDVERSNGVAQPTRKFRAMAGDSAGCEACAVAMDEFVPLWALQITDAELKEHCPAAVLTSASSTMLRKGLTFFGMAKEDFAVGRDWLGFATLRMHFQGFRVVMAWKTIEVYKFKRDLDKAAGIVHDPTGKYNFKELDDFLEDAAGDHIKDLMCLPSFCHSTFGAGSMLLLPPGWTVMEKTLGLTSFGIKRSLFPNQQDTLTSMRDELEMLVSPPRGGLSSLTIADAVVKARGEIARPIPAAETPIPQT